MQPKNAMNRFPIVLCLAVVLSGLQLCPGFAIDISPVEQRAYENAVKDAQIVNQGKVSNRLVAVLPDCVSEAVQPPTLIRDPMNRDRLCGSRIVWNEDLSRVLVVSFLDRSSYEAYYKDYIGQEYSLKKSLWVTVVPELRNFFIAACSHDTTRRVEPCPPTSKRIHKLLGINPAKTYEILVEMWVSPKDLFRPSPDPEVTDHESEVVVLGESTWTYLSDSNPFLKPKFSLLDLSKKYVEAQWDIPNKEYDYKSWFQNRVATIYTTSDGGWPWTQLGYTYDWGNARNHVGLSEFVIRLDPEQGGQVNVKLEKAIDSKTPEWRRYFRCRPEARTGNPQDFPACSDGQLGDGMREKW